MEILYALACDEQEVGIVYIHVQSTVSNTCIPGPGPVFFTPLGKRLAYSKIISKIISNKFKIYFFNQNIYSTPPLP